MEPLENNVLIGSFKKAGLVIMVVARRANRISVSHILVFAAAGIIAPAHGQTTATVSQSVGQRNTIGALTLSPTSGLVTGSTATFSYILHTGGAPAPASETVQFLDGSTSIGSPQSIASVPASNLLPYSQVDLTHGWTTSGNTPTVTPGMATGPDGSTSTATQIAFPSTTSSSSGVLYPVPGTNYAGLAMTLSVWAKSASATALTLALTDSPVGGALQSSVCSVTNTWQRCMLTYTYPAGSGTGFAASLKTVGVAAETILLWGAQVEQASSANPYVSTIGTARPTGGQGGTVSFPYSALLPGTHTITVSYGGDGNFVASTSNAVVVVVSQATPVISLTASQASPVTYGTAVTLTAQLTVPGGATAATGTVQFFDGSTSLGTVAVGSGSAGLTLSSISSLTAGAHSLTAVYSGDSNYGTVTSSALSYSVTKAHNTLSTTATSSLNPSIYGDSIIFSMHIASSAGVTPTGTVVIADGGSSIGTATLDGSGNAGFTANLFTVGTHTITFTYSGDNNYN